MGIHYTFGANKGSRLMEKKAKREIKEGKKKEENVNTLNVQEPITLDFITNPNKNKWIIKKKILSLN